MASIVHTLKLSGAELQHIIGAMEFHAAERTRRYQSGEFETKNRRQYAAKTAELYELIKQLKEA